MKKINWKLFNMALWIELVLAYLLPFNEIDEFEAQVGYPIPFLSVYNTTRSVSPFSSMLFYPLLLVVDGIIIYYALVICMKLYNHWFRPRIQHRKQNMM